MVDPSATPDFVFDEIADFNVDCWGGRHNPIIPVVNKGILPSYWRLLEIADADLIVCCSEIDQTTIEELDRRLGPTSIDCRWKFSSRSEFRISLDNQASNKNILLNLGQFYPWYARLPEPSVLVFNVEKTDTKTVSPFIRRNFGVSRDAYFLTRDRGVRGTFPDSDSDSVIIECVGQTANLVLPMEICRSAPLRHTVAAAWPHKFLICYGDSPWTFLRFWNDAHLKSYHSGASTGIDQLWLPSKTFKDTAAYEALITLIRRRVFTSGRQREMTLASVEVGTAELRDIAERICRDTNSNLYPGAPELIEQDGFPICEIGGPPFGLDRRLPQHAHVRGTPVFIGFDRPREVDNEGNDIWMADLRVEDPYQDKYYSNANLWWRLPKRQSLGGLFTRGDSTNRHRPSRVGADGELSVEVTARDQAVRLTLPSLPALFHSLLLPESWLVTRMDLRDGMRRSYEETLTLSEKGKYLNGVLNLFSSLSEAVYFFENRFWRGLLEQLCCPRLSEQVRSKASKDISRDAETFIRDYHEDRTAAIEWLTEKVVQAGDKIPLANQPIRFVEVEKWHMRFLEQLPAEWAAAAAAHENMQQRISDLTLNRVLLQGAEIHCNYCMSTFWYHVDELSALLTCTGCRSEIALPAETIWCYRPNELVRAAVRYQGVVPVIRVIGRLFEDARDCFKFLAGAVLFDYKRDKRTAEIDLCWMLDGEFGLAEVKQSSRLFGPGACENLIRVAQTARPDRVLVAATDGEDQDLERTREKLVKSLAPLGMKVDVWGPGSFSTLSPRAI
ncbi:MAG: hypothetical protein HY644_02630 [Acidobacteria bacterium]|nr:hypothetical protein [Acidobacteriota bacterium]